MTNNSPAVDEGAMSVTFSRPAGTFLYSARKPRLSLNGGEPVALPWGTHRLSVAAGRHRVQAWVPYLFPPRAGRAEAVVAVTYDEDRSQIRTGNGPQVMAALRNAAISALRLTGITNIATANRHHARDSHRPLALLGVT
ncbi:hypothetical protein [Micromonospora deserti]|uniref:hypothetical protein n=1 Tax=Micromonospora deserti TaxID=2070366 RepID=UPI001F2FAAC4